MDDTPQLLTKRQLAELLQVSQRTVDRWLFENRLPASIKVEISGTVRYRPDVAQQWIADGCPQHQTEVSGND
jgi:predicted DNA-binding transcriptional regulator AlpA